jgi:hypothetical protein
MYLMGHLSLSLSRLTLRPFMSSLVLQLKLVRMSQVVEVAEGGRCPSVRALAILVSSLIATIMGCWLALVCNKYPVSYYQHVRWYVLF